MSEIRTKIGVGGRVVIPSRYRKTIGAEVGDEVILILEGGEVHLLTPLQAVKRAQRLVRKYIPPGERLVNEVIDDRRKEIERG